MSDTHLINHDVVNDTTTRLINQLTEASYTTQNYYYNAIASIDNLDSATHAAFVAGTLRNERKAVVTVEVLCKLLDFVKNASEEYRHLDKMLAYQIQQMEEAMRPRGGSGARSSHAAMDR